MLSTLNYQLSTSRQRSWPPSAKSSPNSAPTASSPNNLWNPSAPCQTALTLNPQLPTINLPQPGWPVSSAASASPPAPCESATTSPKATPSPTSPTPSPASSLIPHHN